MLSSLTTSINATPSPWAQVSAYLERTSPYVCPFTVNQLQAAGLLDVVTGLGGSTPAARKSQAYARLLARGLVYGEEQIDHIAHVQTQIRAIQQQLQQLDASELSALGELAGQLQELVASAQAYFRA